jgi:hypothetical protein
MTVFAPPQAGQAGAAPTAREMASPQWPQSLQTMS